MRLTFVSLFTVKAWVAPPQTSPCRWWWCSISNKTSKLANGTRAPSRLSKRWMEYHGSNNWEGLLDPLDDVLRGEIIRYGSFVEAAYQAFDFDPSSPTYAACHYAKTKMLERSGMRGCGYRVMKYLYATSSISLPSWMENMPTWMQVQSSWIGYVAVCKNMEEISRLGRRDIVIALRGTATCLEWLENLQVTLTRCSGDDPIEQNNEPMVEAGVLSLYTSGTNRCPSLQQLLRQEVLKILELYRDEPLSLTITGHSLGASLAIIAAHDIKTAINNSPHLSVISFGGPRVGNRSFRHHLEQQGVKVLRIVNSDDLITKVPGFFVEDYDGVVHEQNAHVVRLPKWIQKHVKDSRLVYANIGHELRLSSRDLLRLNRINVATCHDLKTYLDLVNGFVSSTCPFRSGARRIHKNDIVK